MTMQQLNVSDIRTDGGTQPPDRLDQAAVAEYAEMMKAGVAFDPIEVVLDGADYWLAHGFHRLAAGKLIGATEIAADVTEGTLQDALDIATAANKANGVRRSPADKRWAVENALMLDRERQQDRSDRAIAEHCGVSHEFVRQVRAEAAKDQPETEGEPKTRKGKDGKSYKAKKGKKKADDTEVDESIPEEPTWDDNEGVEVKDAEGQIVPARLHEMFTTGRKAFIGWMKQVSDMKGAVLETAQTQLGFHIRAQQFEKDCLNIFESLKFACPHAVCSACNGEGLVEGDECGACKGLGWLNRSRFEALKKHKKKSA